MKDLMTNHWRRSNAAIKEMNVWDIGLLKGACVAAGLLAAKLVPGILAGPVWLYVVLMAAFLLPSLGRFFPKYASVKVK